MIENFENLKETCARKLEEANRLYREKVGRMVEQELEQETIILGDRICKVDHKYYLDDKIAIYVDTNGDLDIIDDRGTAFGWLFNVQFDEELRINDIFLHNGKPYSVRYVNPNDFDGVCDAVTEVISEVETTIDKLGKAPDPLQWNHNYYDCHEEITCNTISDALNVVVERKPTVW